MPEKNQRTSKQEKTKLLHAFKKHAPLQKY